MNEASRKIRVLRIIARMNIGGPAIQVTNLMQSIPDSRFQQLLVSGLCETNEQDYLDAFNIEINVKKIKHLGRAINPLLDLIAFFKLRRIIKHFAPDIIHTHTFKAGLIGRLAACIQSRRIFLVHTFHGHLLHGYYGKFGTRIIIALERILAYKTTRLVSVGTTVKSDLLERGIGDPEQFKVINPGFKIKQPESISRSWLGYDENDFICGWFGRITKIKRVDRVLEIAALANFSNRKNVKFLVVGDGEDREELEAKALELKLPIIFLGWQSDVPALMTMCNIVFCTSENEGTPISLIEAQMLGRPVISTKVGSVEEVMISGKTGFALDYEPQKYWEKILYLIDNPTDYEIFSKESAIFAINHFSLANFIEKHVSLYDEILRINPILRP
jgi:glycosyltransferase involved in cell wall biosynthesis